jgi:hypothetical protein
MPKKWAAHKGLRAARQGITGANHEQRPDSRDGPFSEYTQGRDHCGRRRRLRAGQPLPKQFAMWRGKPVVRHSVERLIAAGVAPIVVVIPEGADEVAGRALDGLPVRLVTAASRQDLVRAGLKHWPQTPAIVHIHDAARPILPLAVVERLENALWLNPA